MKYKYANINNNYIFTQINQYIGIDELHILRVINKQLNKLSDNILDSKFKNINKEDWNTEDWYKHIINVGQLDILEWSILKGNTLKNNGSEMIITLTNYLQTSECIINLYDLIYNIHSSDNKYYKILVWLQTQGCSWDDISCENVALYGSLDLLKLLRAYNYMWNSKTCSNAALIGDLEMLKYAVENGCSWNGETCSNAALTGDLEVLKYAIENGCPWNTQSWVNNNGCISNDSYILTCSNAALTGDLEMLKYAKLNGCPWDGLTYVNAFINNHTDILEWAKLNNCPWGISTYSINIVDSNVICKAITLQNYELLEWAIHNGCPFKIYNTRDAARINNSKFLKIIIKNKDKNKKFMWSNKTTDVFAKNNNLKLLKYVIKNGCPWSDTFEKVAIENNNYDLIQWKIDNNYYNTQVTYGTYNSYNHIIKLIPDTHIYFKNFFKNKQEARVRKYLIYIILYIFVWILLSTISSKFIVIGTAPICLGAVCTIFYLFFKQLVTI